METTRMETTAKALGLDRLTVEERMRLVEEIWDSITAEAEALAAPQSHREELDHRLAAYRANPHAGSSWEEVKARLMGGSGSDR
jgi:putative addiction module component (TIGR02574 family)